VAVEALEEKGKLRATIAADAPPGVCWLRVFDSSGAAALRPFIVGELPETVEVEPNDVPGKAQTLTLPITVNGRLAQRGDVDSYLVSLEAGATLTAALQANSVLGSPLDGVLEVCEVAERPVSKTAGAAPRVESFVLAQSQDSIGLDPCLEFKAPRAGRFLIRVFAFPSQPDGSISFAGGDTFVYRLTLTTGSPFEPPLPVAESPRGETKQIPATPTARPGSPQPVVAPCVITGRLATAGQVDAFKFRAAKGEKLVLRLDSKKLGSRLDGVLSVTDSQGKLLKRVDDVDNDRDPVLAFAASSERDDDYIVEVRDVNERGGARFGYRLSIARETPDFALSLAAQSFVLVPGTPLEIPVTIQREFGYRERITLAAVGLPAGVTAAAAVSEGEGESAKQVKLVLNAPAGTTPTGLPIRIEGRAESAPDAVRIARFSLGLPLAGQHSAAWLTVKAADAK
jgi:hypothetical protein